MRKTTKATLEDRLAQVVDLRALLVPITSAVVCAETVETPEDFDANLDAVEDGIKELLAALKEIRS